ncbi:MAG: hypothetical protein Q8R29_03200 [bacterium]|nr:hypothetical protein [bacterium]
MEDEKMPDRLFYAPVIIGFVVCLVIGSIICYELFWKQDYNQQKLLEYKKELFLVLAEKREDVVHQSPLQASILTGNFLLEQHRQGTNIDSLFKVINYFNYVLPAFDTDKEKKQKTYLLAVLKESGRFSDDLFRAAEDHEFNTLIDNSAEVKTINLLLAKKIQAPEIKHALPEFPYLYAFYVLLISQCVGYLVFIIRVLWWNGEHTQEYRWRDAPWGKPGTLILVVPGGLVWIAIYGIVIFFGNDWLERVKNRQKETGQSSLKNLGEYSDKDTENLAKKLQKNIEGGG